VNSNVDFEYLRYISDSADKKAILHELMTAYGNDVWNYAFSITRKWEQADDITQEVFLKVYRNLFTFRSESSVKTWLLAITRNTALDYKKSAFLRKVTLVDYIAEKGAQRSAELEVIEKMSANEIWSMVLSLPIKYREVLILHGHYQLTMKEIAQVLGIREGTVKSRLHHARLKIIKMKESGSHGSLE
jgi:RNA polymerase sigma-70 factor (ECF subfamily)